jgi:hypothetical protein
MNQFRLRMYKEKILELKKAKKITAQDREFLQELRMLVRLLRKG